MARGDRLFELMQLLRKGGTHRAQDLAQALGVSVRTIWRDVDRLRANGVPVAGTRGAGYRITDAVILPPLNLAQDELDALNLGMAIVLEANDPDLKAAATRLAAKIDAVLPERVVADADLWKFAASPWQNAARGFSHLATVRAAIRARQKLRVTGRDPGKNRARIVRPLQLACLGRIWTLTAWCETGARFAEFRLDLIETAEALPELFTDEPGKRLADLP